MRASSNDASAAITSSSRGQMDSGYYLPFFLLSRVETTKSGANSLKRLYVRRKQRNTVCVVVCFSFATAFVVCIGSCRPPGRISRKK